MRQSPGQIGHSVFGKVPCQNWTLSRGGVHHLQKGLPAWGNNSHHTKLAILVKNGVAPCQIVQIESGGGVRNHYHFSDVDFFVHFWKHLAWRDSPPLVHFKLFLLLFETKELLVAAHPCSKRRSNARCFSLHNSSKRDPSSSWPSCLDF